MTKTIRIKPVMSLLVLLLAIGPLLFVVPTVVAAKPDVDPVLIRVDGSLVDDSGVPWTEWFDINPADIPFTDPTWKQVGDIYDVTVKEAYEEALDLYLNDGNTHDVEILLIIANKYKNKPEGLFVVQYAQFCDFDGDGEVTGHDTRMISTHMNNPGTYVWTYDLDQDGDIDTDDIHIADSYKGTYEQWITLPIPPTRIAIIDSTPYLIADLWHFSGWGIRR